MSLYGRWRGDPEFWLEADYRKRRQAFGDWGRGGGYFMGAPHQALLMVSGSRDPYFSFVKLLINPASANTTTTFTDLSPIGRTLTAHGNAQHSTSITKFTSSSMLFDGTSDNITAPNTTDFDVYDTGGQKATWEVWTYTTVNNELNFILSNRTVTGTGPCWYLYMSATGKVTFTYQVVSGVAATSTASLSTNTWQFLQINAAPLPSVETDIYIDGSIDGGVLNAGSTGTTNGLLYIGTSSGEDGTRDWKGNLGPTRITLGVTRAVVVPLAAFPTS